MTTTSIKSEITDSFTKFDQLINSFPSKNYEFILIGEYKFKDILAHIYEWEKFLLDNLPLIVNKTIIPHKLNIKKMNLEFYVRNKDRNLNDIKADLYTNHRKLINLIENFPDNLLSQPDPFYPRKYSIYNLIQHTTSLHYLWASTFIAFPSSLHTSGV